jgi:signal transduction histidine kinase
MRLTFVPDRLRRKMGVRLRSALAAALVVAVASVLAGAVLLVTARAILLDNVTGAATDRAGQIATALAAGDSEAITSVVRPAAPERTVIQVLDASGMVIAASDAVTGAPAMSGLRPAAGRQARQDRRLSIGQGSPFRIVASGVATPDGPRTVLVAESLDLVDDGTEAIVAALLIGLPLLALTVAVATFFFVGRTLQPVEAMRRQAATITTRNLHARLPVPAADDEIAALACTMNTMLDRIEAATTAQRRFVADASHELRSPLATIHANADLLAAAGLPESPARSVTRISGESRRMARLVDDLLLLARIDDHVAAARPVDVDLDDLVYAARERIAVERPDLTVTGKVEPLRITGDPDQLHRVLRNLTDNAIRHARTAVTVSLTSRAGQAEILVGNDGPAIPVADRERVFDRFVRMDDSRARDRGGSGLGLSIARDIVAAHGGTLTIADVPAGAVMRILIPIPEVS